MRLLTVLGCLVAAGPGVFLSLPARAQPPTPLPQGAQEEPTQLPEVRVTAPARLPGSPLPLSSVPATVDVVPGDQLRATGAVTLQEVARGLLRRRERGVSCQLEGSHGLRHDQQSSQQRVRNLRNLRAKRQGRGYPGRAV